MRTSPPEYSPETGLLTLAEQLHTRYGPRIRCPEPGCASRVPSVGFIKDCGGKQDSEGRRRRLWKCRYTSSCGKKITCTRYIKIAQELLDSNTFTSVVVSVRDERASRGLPDRDWSEWLANPKAERVSDADEASRGTKRKASSLKESLQVLDTFSELFEGYKTPERAEQALARTVARKLFQTPQPTLVTPTRQSERLASKKRVCFELSSDDIVSPDSTPGPVVEPLIPNDLWTAVRHAHSALGKLIDQETAPTLAAKSIRTRIPTPFHRPGRTAAILASEFGKCQSQEERRSLRKEAKAVGPRFLQLFNKNIWSSKSTKP